MKEQFEQKEIEYVRGKIAGNDVNDDQGNTIVSNGQMITEDIINRARATGQLHYLMIAAASSAVKPGEDLQRRLSEFRDVTEGHEVDFVRGKQVAYDVKDFQGNLIIQEGDIINDDILNRAQQAGILQKLVLAVGAPGLMDEDEETHPETTEAKMGYTPFPH